MSKITAYFQKKIENVSKQIPLNTNIEKIFSYRNSSFLQFTSKTIFHNALLFKNAQISRDLAYILILDNGDLDKKVLEDSISFLEKNLFSIQDNCEYENLYRQHILFVLKKLRENKNFSRQLNKVFVPIHAHIQKLILNTLLLPKNTTLSLAHVKRALLSALFTYLRQDIGSCFATAPAILIQQKYPEKMLQDLDDLISSGTLSRIVNNKVLTIPINLLNSLGSLNTPIFIKKLGSSPIYSLANDPSLQTVFSTLNFITTDPLKDCLKLLDIPSIQNICKNPDNSITAYEILVLSLAEYYNLPIKEVDNLQLNNANKKEKNDFFSHLALAKETFIHTNHNALLKSWELSLASLAEAEANFSKQHLSIALGINESQDSFSIAGTLKRVLEQEILSTNKDIEEAESKYNHLKGQISYIDTRLKHPINKQDSENLIAEFRLRRQELNRILAEWSDYQDKQKRLQNLNTLIINYYSDIFSQYFQALYDPEIVIVNKNFYEDTLAGFRIFYTHGRKNVGTWTPLYSEDEFIYALSSFFSTTEIDLKEKNFSKKLEKEIESCIGEIISTIHTHDFLLGSFQRISSFYKEPLPKNPIDNSFMLKYKPWVYVSGGSPNSFLKAYFQLKESPKTLLKQAESPKELLAFFADSIKDLPAVIKNNYLHQNKAFFLTSSPTHLFLSNPSSQMFRKCWDNDWYSYSWIRDIWETQQKKFLSKTLLNQGAIFRLLEEVQKQLIGNFHYKQIFNEFFQDLNLNIPEFYQKTLRCFDENKIPASKRLEYDLASLLFSVVPLTGEQQLKDTINNISHTLSCSSKISYEKFQPFIEELIPKFSFITAKELLTLYKSLSIQAFNYLYFDEDFHYRIINAMRELSLLFPAPLILGDSNWGTEFAYLGFIVHPGTQEIDFWQFNPEGSSGTPMAQWQKFFKEKSHWTFFSDPICYGFSSDIEKDPLSLDLI